MKNLLLNYTGARFRNSSFMIVDNNYVSACFPRAIMQSTATTTTMMEYIAGRNLPYEEHSCTQNSGEVSPGGRRTSTPFGPIHLKTLLIKKNQAEAKQRNFSP